MVKIEDAQQALAADIERTIRKALSEDGKALRFSPETVTALALLINEELKAHVKPEDLIKVEGDPNDPRSVRFTAPASLWQALCIPFDAPDEMIITVTLGDQDR